MATLEATTRSGSTGFQNLRLQIQKGEGKMNRLVKYFIISMICNIAILALLFLPYKSSIPKPTDDGKPVKGVSLIPATILPDLNEKSINESLDNRRYRPTDVAEDNNKSVKTNQDEKPDEDKYVKSENVVEIPDLNKKKKKLMTPDEYKRFKNSLQLEGTIVTEMRVNFPKNLTEHTIREIISFFGFKIVAYPAQNPDHLLVCKGPEFKFEKLNTSDQLQKFYSNNSNRTIEPEKELLTWVRSELAKQGINASGLNISILLGNSAGYFHWKEMLAAKNISRPITDVRHTEASISRTPQGYWLLLVDGIHLNDGQYLNVDDQELKEILL